MKKALISLIFFFAALFSGLLPAVVSQDYAALAADGSFSRIGPEMIWRQPQDILNHYDEVHNNLYGYMKKNGASPQAIDFARRMEGEILTQFRQMGQVDLAYMELPIQGASYAGSHLLVNGTPAVIVVGYGKESKNLKFRTDQALVRQYPKVDFFGNSIRFIKMERLTPGGQRFIFAFDLNNGCNACELVGEADVAYDFDASGGFLGAKMLQIKRK